MSYEIRIEVVSATPTAVVRREARPEEFAAIIPAACGVVWSALRAADISGAGRHIALYLDGVVHLEVGVELNQPLDTGRLSPGDVIASTLPAGTVATTTHFGPYGDLHFAHRAILDWCAARGHRLAGPYWETYGHWLETWNTDPSRIRTDVSYLLSVRP